MKCKRKGQQSCSIRKSVEVEWGAVITYIAKFEKETSFKRNITKAIAQASKFTENITKQTKKKNYQLQIFFVMSSVIFFLCDW